MNVPAVYGKGPGLVPAGARGLRQAASNRGGRAGYPVRLVVIVAALCLAAASCGENTTTRTVSPLQVRSCTVQGQPARCGTLAAPEDRLTGQGRQIEIKFVVFPATGRHRAPDPVVYFAGGPGDSAVGEAPDQLDAMAGLNQDRDLVFID